jgi:tRNA-dihydrouridine synthase B
MKRSFRIGPHTIHGAAVLAPMAGLTDQAFRNLCRDFGAAMAISEMNTANRQLWTSAKSQTRLKLNDENGLKIVQIAGSEPQMLADAAAGAEELGADIIDINMGCPAKKVCRKLAGSALLKDEKLVRDILEAVVAATALPVTLKTRTGWDVAHRNSVEIAMLAESVGIQALSIHGRTRACMFKGAAEYETIRNIKQRVSIPVLANGDIDSVQTARDVLDFTQADAVMIGRGALGRPWIFSLLNRYLDVATLAEANSYPKIDTALQRDTILGHLSALHHLYGEQRGVRVARKHLSWYCKYLNGAGDFWQKVVKAENAVDQLQITKNFFLTNQNPGRVDGRSRSIVPCAVATHDNNAAIKTQTKHQTSLHYEIRKDKKAVSKSQSAA